MAEILCSIIDDWIADEYKDHKKYKEMAGNLEYNTYPDIVVILSHISNQELEHAKLLSAIKNNYCIVDSKNRIYKI